jgi:hypothetical protein
MARIEMGKDNGAGFAQLHVALGRKFSVQIVQPLGVVDMRKRRIRGLQLSYQSGQLHARKVPGGEVEEGGSCAG